MSRVYNPLEGYTGDSLSESKTFRNCNRVQLDFGQSPIEAVEVMGRLDEDAEWVSLLGLVNKAADSEILIVPRMPYQKIIFWAGDGTEVAYAVNLRSESN